MHVCYLFSCATCRQATPFTSVDGIPLNFIALEAMQQIKVNTQQQAAQAQAPPLCHECDGNFFCFSLNHSTVHMHGEPGFLLVCFKFVFLNGCIVVR